MVYVTYLTIFSTISSALSEFMSSPEAGTTFLRPASFGGTSDFEGRPDEGRDDDADGDTEGVWRLGHDSEALVVRVRFRDDRTLGGDELEYGIANDPSCPASFRIRPVCRIKCSLTRGNIRVMTRTPSNENGETIYGHS